MSLSRKRMDRAIANSCMTHRRSAAVVVVQGGMPPTQAPDPPIETVVVRKGATWIVRGGVPPLPREPPSQKQGQGAA
jgi:hypothetical protein